MSQQLNQGATVYAGDRVQLTVALTGKDPATGQQVPVAIPADAIVEWTQGQGTPGAKLAFETEVSRFDSLKGTGGPATVTALIDKVGAVAGQVRVNCAVRNPGETVAYWVTAAFKFTTAPGERPMTQPNPTPTQAKPENATLTAVLLPRVPLPGK